MNRFLTCEQFRTAFATAWRELYEADPSILEHVYASSRSLWTELMFGANPSSIGGASLLARTLKQLRRADLEIEFDRERHGVDVFGRVLVQEMRASYAGYVNVLMIEVENDTKTSYEEFWKLLHARCPMRVLITYELDHPEIHETALRTYESMYRHAEHWLGADAPDSYLVIIGTRRGLPPRIAWRYYELRDGRFTETTACPDASCGGN